MTRAGILGAASLATEVAEELVLGTVRDVHGAVATRVHGVLDHLAGGPTVTHRAHDGLSRGVYAGLGYGLKGSARLLRAADAAADRAGIGTALEDTARGRFVLSAVNGLIGDRLLEERPEHSFDMTVRHRGRDVPLDPGALATAFPEAGESVVVFLHGMSESEAFWRRGHAEIGRTYADTVAELGWTPVFLRVNTGLPVARNGVALAALLDELTTAWPVAVRRIALVGHSMGGLIARSACAVATDAPEPWAARVSNVVLLGTPHLGAPLARIVEVAASSLGRLPESAPFGRILDTRAAGVHDLVRGLGPEVPPLPHARYHLVGATLSRSKRHPVAETLGDKLVAWSSAMGRPRRGPEMFPGADTVHLPGCDHFDLLNHEDVHTALRTWLYVDRPATARPA